MKKDKLADILIEIFLWVLSLVVLVPFAIAILGSFKNQAEAGAFSLRLPSEWIFSNYSQVIEEAHIETDIILGCRFPLQTGIFRTTLAQVCTRRIA